MKKIACRVSRTITRTRQCLAPFSSIVRYAKGKTLQDIAPKKCKGCGEFTCQRERSFSLMEKGSIWKGLTGLKPSTEIGCLVWRSKIKGQRRMPSRISKCLV